MCGILCIINKVESTASKNLVKEKVIGLLNRRGPDKTHSHTTQTTCIDDTKLELSFYGSVLHLRGDLTQQPLVNSSGDVFLWNGEVFGGSVQVLPSENDTEVMFQKCLEELEKDGASGLAHLLSTVHGPWAMMLYQASTGKLFFSRDYFGRRSLLMHHSDDGWLLSLSSVASRDDSVTWEELPAKKLLCISLSRFCTGTISDNIDSYDMIFETDPSSGPHVHACLRPNRSSFETDLLPTNLTDSNDTSKYKMGMESICCSCQYDKNSKSNANDFERSQEALMGLSMTDLPSSEDSTTNQCCICQSSSDMSNIKKAKWYQEQLFNLLLESVRTRVHNLPRTAVQKSNRFSKQDCNTDNTIPIDSNSHHISDIADRNHYVNVVSELHISREDAVVDSKSDNLGTLSRVGILFSGGIDSMVLAALADMCVPEGESIDLINVAFEQKAKPPQGKKKTPFPSNLDVKPSYNVPDRISGQDGVRELNRNRVWNFVEVNVTLEELKAARSSRIADLVYPLESVLDDSIGSAIWFAARGVGECFRLAADGQFVLLQSMYRSPVKVLLTGMGADEQLGGYSRHRGKFEKFGWAGLKEEMTMEMDRISSRNLGRDDRCVSDHGREARFPFLDENVVRFLQQVPTCIKCDPRLPRGFGEKILLRQVAYTKLKLSASCFLPKRAIQFGSRIAKMEGSKEKGGDKCERLR